jgi:hypothetical protein
MNLIIEIFRSFARAHRASVFAKQGNYQKARDIMSREYEVHP